MSVTKYHNQWRATWVDSSGKLCQAYYTNKAVAEAIQERERRLHAMRRPPWATRNAKKREGADPTLPIGFHESYKIRNGEEYRYIACTYIVDGEIKRKSKSFGKKITREQAVDQLIAIMYKEVRFK